LQRHAARSQDDRLDLDLSPLVEKGRALRPDEFPVVGTDLAQQRNGFSFGVCKGNCRGVLDLNVEGQGQPVAHAAVLDWHLPPKPSEDQTAMKPPSGIGGQDPRKHASAKVGQRSVELAAEALARKAKELLDSLPEDQRSFNLKAVSPEHWWLV
jgi:hypothetical protein